MGRNAPESEFQFITCYNQTTGNFGPDYNELRVDVPVLTPTNNQTPLTTGNIFMRSTGVSRGNVFSGNKGVPYPNNTLVWVTDDNRAVWGGDPSFLTGIAGISGNSIRTGVPVAFSTKPIYGVGTTGYVLGNAGNFIFPILPNVSATKINVGYSSGAYGEYVDLNETGGLFLTYGNVSQGHVVGIQPLTFTNTGVITGAITTLNDTRFNSGSGTLLGKLTFPCIVKDTSYTGDVSRVLIGYQAVSGVGSGQLCALLAEISGSTITTGEPVIIRSIVNSALGNYGTSIKACYHSAGTASGSFVIATTVVNTSDFTKSTSGEIIACNPASGVTLSGTFGTAATIYKSNTTGSTGYVSRAVCQAMNTWTGVSGFGIVCAITGGTTGSNASGNLSVQRYYLSGTTITTGIAQNPFTADTFNTLCNWGSGSDTTDTPDQTNYLAEYAGSGSGFFDYIDVVSSGFVTGVKSYFTSATGIQYHIGVPASLTSGAPTYSGDASGAYTHLNYRISGFYYFSPNIYSGSFSGITSAALHCSRSVVTSTGSGSGAVHLRSLVVSGVINQGVSYSSPTVLLSSGINYDPVSCLNVNKSGAVSGCGNLNIIKISGTMPNISTVHTLAKSGFGTDTNSTGIGLITFSLTSGTTNAGYQMRTYSGAFSNLNGPFPQDLNLGIVVNTLDTGNGVYSLASGAVTVYPASGIVVKVAKTPNARRQLVEQGLKGFAIVDARSAFDAT